MDPLRRIEGINCALASGEAGAAEIRAAARTLESSVPAGEVLAAVADRCFPSALIAAAEDCAASEESAWLTLAAAGAGRARQVLAWRASQLLDPGELATLAMKRRRPRARGFARRAVKANDPGASAAWSLLAHLSVSELRAIVRARPALAAARRRGRGGWRRVAAAGAEPALG